MLVKTEALSASLMRAAGDSFPVWMAGSSSPRLTKGDKRRLHFGSGVALCARRSPSLVQADVYADVFFLPRAQVSGVAFDSHWSQPPSEEGHEAVTYRFGSVGQVSVNLLFLSSQRLVSG